METALSLSKEIGSNNYIKESYNGLTKLDSATGNWKAAYFHHKMYFLYRDSLINEDNTKKIVQSQMQYEFDKKETITKAAQDKKDAIAQVEVKRQRNIRNSTFGGLAGVLIFSIVVYRQRNKISKEKKRSDELLLNILPAETAEELKNTGTTKAKDFDEVTVLFTDFKNFTKRSEQLSAQELVNEINYCYSAFDNIITKYGIEKIKTMGDSYMCAGGLPVANKTNAEDTVKAAIEIRDFILTYTASSPLGKTSEAFEIRIGLHTGPVVAGIVGIKKYSYDIWGDTVNIASRMESSGEPGKVNISGSTYELVKDKFKCEHRGKIEAKNKGMIDMYFAEV
ncbi:MAG: adenylate/guanylate cyclase domain-containing protein [Bacteroidia bacterium]